ncbi:MAG: VOC family protein [Pseudomonadota bacterium]
MNHFTMVTDDLEATKKFYAMFGLRSGPRPPLSVPGVWLYATDTPILHVILRDKDKLPEPDGLLDHMAFTASDLPAVVKTIEGAGYEYDLRRQPESRTWQLFLRDPTGVKVEFDFDKDEHAPPRPQGRLVPTFGESRYVGTQYSGRFTHKSASADLCDRALAPAPSTIPASEIGGCREAVHQETT